MSSFKVVKKRKYDPGYPSKVVFRGGRKCFVEQIPIKIFSLLTIGFLFFISISVLGCVKLEGKKEIDIELDDDIHDKDSPDDSENDEATDFWEDAECVTNEDCDPDEYCYEGKCYYDTFDGGMEPYPDCRYDGCPDDHKCNEWTMDCEALKDNEVVLVEEIPLSESETEEHCPDGGVKVIAGVDENGNGELDENEIMDIHFICDGEEGYSSPIWEGTYIVNSLKDIEELDKLRFVTGSLVIAETIPVEDIVLNSLEIVGRRLDMTNNQTVKSLVFKKLKRCGEILVSDNDNLTSLEFEGLETVGGSLWVRSNKNLLSLGFPLLETTGNSLWIRSNPELLSLSFPALEMVDKNFMVNLNDALAFIELPVLRTVKGNLSLWENVSMTHFEAPLLERVLWSLFISLNAALDSFVFPSLGSVGKDFRIVENAELTSFDFPVLKITLQWFLVSGNAKLRSFNIPFLERIPGSLYINFNDTLDSFDMSGVTRIGGSLNIYSNPSLPTSTAEAFRDQVLSREGIGGSVTISDNKP